MTADRPMWKGAIAAAEARQPDSERPTAYRLGAMLEEMALAGVMDPFDKRDRAALERIGYVRAALPSNVSEPPHPPPDDWREALEWALDNLDAEDEVIGDAMSWAVTAGGKTTTMARSTEYEAGKQKARAILAALPPSDPPA